MAHLTKKAVLAQIREKLHSQSFIPTVNHNDPALAYESDIVHAANETLRANGHDPNVDYLSGELKGIIETLTAKRAEVAPGNRVARSTFLSSRTVKTNGEDPLPEEATLRFEKQAYTVPTHTAHPVKRKSEPRWTRSELDLELTLRDLETFYRDHQWVLSGHETGSFYGLWPRRQAGIVTPSATRLASGYHVNGAIDADIDTRTVRSIARSRQDAYINAAENARIATLLASNRMAEFREHPEMERVILDTVIPSPTYHVEPQPKPQYAQRPNVLTETWASRPRHKWFHVNPPALAMRAR